MTAPVHNFETTWYFPDAGIIDAVPVRISIDYHYTPQQGGADVEIISLKYVETNTEIPNEDFGQPIDNVLAIFRDKIMFGHDPSIYSEFGRLL